MMYLLNLRVTYNSNIDASFIAVTNAYYFRKTLSSFKSYHKRNLVVYPYVFTETQENLAWYMLYIKMLGFSDQRLSVS